MLFHLKKTILIFQKSLQKEGLTSGNESVDVFDFANGRMITITHDILDGIDEAVDVDNRTRILDFDLQVADATAAILV